MMLRRLNRPRLAAFVGVTSYLASQTAATAAGPPAPAAVVVGVSNSPGLGFAIAKRFAEGGHSVGIIGRTQERLDACKSEILAAVPGANIICISADATDAQAVKRAFSELKQAHGAPDALVRSLVLSDHCLSFPRCATWSVYSKQPLLTSIPFPRYTISPAARFPPSKWPT
jgi:NAD(P)-dependent dehydrogenase (short-subunit alcohol dehydrogenase family)